MVIPQYLLDAVEDQRKLVLEIENPRIVHLAERIAFYSAMIDAANDDPEDFDHKEELLEHFNNILLDHIDCYIIAHF